MKRPIDQSAWFRPNPNDEGYLVNHKGVLLLAFQLQATEPNEQTTRITNTVIGLATQNGYTDTRMLQRALDNPRIDANTLAQYADQISHYVSPETIIGVLSK